MRVDRTAHRVTASTHCERGLFMSIPTELLILFIAQTALLAGLLLRRRRRADKAVRGVGVVPMHIIDVHRRRADWAATEHTMTLPVVADTAEPPVAEETKAPTRRSRRRSRRRPQEVPGLDAEVIQLGRRISRRVRGEGDAS